MCVCIECVCLHVGMRRVYVCVHVRCVHVYVCVCVCAYEVGDQSGKEAAQPRSRLP